MFKSHKFLVVTFLVGFGCLNAAEATSGVVSTVSTVANDAFNAASSVATRSCELIKESLQEERECIASGDYILVEDNARYQNNPLKDGVERFGTFCANSTDKLKTACGFKVEEKAPEVQNYNMQKIALIGAGTVVAAFVAYTVYQYVQRLNVDEEELINSILVSASQESEVEAFEKIVSWTGVEAQRNADLVLLTNAEIKSVLKEVAKIKSVAGKKLIIATMLTHFDMNEKTRKNVVAKLRSL